MKNKILTDIIKLAKKVKGSRLNLELLECKDHYIKCIEDYLGLNRMQTIIFVSVFEMNVNNQDTDINALSRHLKCSTIELLAHKNDIEQLFKKGYFETGFFEIISQEIFKEDFVVNKDIEKAILGNNKFKLKAPKTLSNIEICLEIEKQLNKTRDHKTDIVELLYGYDKLCSSYDKNDFIKYIRSYKLNAIDSISTIYIVAENLNGYKESFINSISKVLYSDLPSRLKFEQEIIKKKWPPIKLGLINVHGEFTSDATVCLTQKTCDKLNSMSIPVNYKDHSILFKLTQFNSIPKKRLFYNTSVDNKILKITSFLKQTKYRQIIKSLSAEGFPTGICTIFYGAPGTGKTESVYQIAKTTHRAVWKVDLSGLKSMWYGESQKLVKALFTNYKQLYKKEKKTPILLLNEADAILGKRNINIHQGVDKTENAIQNIFLDCLENLEGILFATTNLEESLDKAFERRFLFKVCFDRPDKNTRQKIWESKLKNINPSDIETLADFELTGGEIDNIIRKFKMAYILNPRIDKNDTLIDLCQNEKLKVSDNNNRIGFL